MSGKIEPAPRRTFNTDAERAAYVLGQNDGIDQAVKVGRLTAVAVGVVSREMQAVLDGFADTLEKFAKILA